MEKQKYFWGWLFIAFIELCFLYLISVVIAAPFIAGIRFAKFCLEKFFEPQQQHRIHPGK